MRKKRDRSSLADLDMHKRLMLAILGLDEDADGDRIRERLRERGLSEGPMYETLERLEDRGLIGPTPDPFAAARAAGPPARKASRRERLMAAIRGYERDAVRDLLQNERVDPDFVDPESRETPLTTAIDNGSIRTFRMLLEHGADIDLRIPRHPLPYAVQHIVFAHALEFLRDAVAHGATLRRRDPNLFDVAFQWNSHLCAAYLYGLDGMPEEFEASEGWRTDPAAAERFLRAARVLAALYDRDFDAFDALLTDSDLDEDEMAGFVHRAIGGFVRYTEPDPVTRSDVRSLERLIRAGASVEAQFAGLTPLKLALNLRERDAARVLLRHGASLDALDESGRTRARELGLAPDPPP